MHGRRCTIIAAGDLTDSSVCRLSFVKLIQFHHKFNFKQKLRKKNECVCTKAKARRRCCPLSASICQGQRHPSRVRRGKISCHEHSITINSLVTEVWLHGDHLSSVSLLFFSVAQVYLECCWLVDSWLSPFCKQAYSYEIRRPLWSRFICRNSPSEWPSFTHDDIRWRGPMFWRPCHGSKQGLYNIGTCDWRHQR